MARGNVLFLTLSCRVVPRKRLLYWLNCISYELHNEFVSVKLDRTFEFRRDCWGRGPVEPAECSFVQGASAAGGAVVSGVSARVRQARRRTNGLIEARRALRQQTVVRANGGTEWPRYRRSGAAAAAGWSERNTSTAEEEEGGGGPWFGPKLKNCRTKACS